MARTEGRITLWMVEIFAAVADAGAISMAAQCLGTSPSTVSQQLTKLESAVATPLVERGARPVRLTPAGEVFLRRARNILDEATLARSELAARDLAHLARFRLGMIEDFDADVTPRLLTEMAATLRDCRFLLETGPSHRLLDQLAARALDVAVAADTGADRAGLEVHPILAEPFVAAVPRDAAGAPVGRSLAELAALTPILYTQRHLMGRQVAAHLARQNVALSPRFELDSYHAILAMVADGLGWTILTPLGLLRAHRFADRVAAVPLPVAPLSRTIALWARRGAMGPLPEQTADRLRTILAEMFVAPATARMPWLGAALRVLPPGAAAPADQVP